jgi:hypothetical protein
MTTTDSIFQRALSNWAAGEANPWAGADGNASWQRTTVTEDQWRTLRDALRHEADTWRKGVAARTSLDDVGAAAALEWTQDRRAPGDRRDSPRRCLLVGALHCQFHRSWRWPASY